MSDSNGTRRIFQQIPMDSIGFQRIPMDFTGKNMKKSENVGKSRKFMIRLFMIRLWLFPKCVNETRKKTVHDEKKRKGNMTLDYFHANTSYAYINNLLNKQKGQRKLRKHIYINLFT